jgi:exosortase/archaeosortase family protein
MRLWLPLKKKRLTPQQERMWRVMLFLVRLTLLSVPLYAVLWLNISLVPMQAVIAGQVAWLLGAAGFGVAVNGLFLTVGEAGAGSFTFFIGPDCTGWKSMIAFFALVFATLGIGMRKRLLGLAAGIPLIYLGNLARITVVVLIERGFGLDAAMVFHDLLWQAGLIALVLALWLAWLEWDALARMARRLRVKHIIGREER